MLKTTDISQKTVSLIFGYLIEIKRDIFVDPRFNDSVINVIYSYYFNKNNKPKLLRIPTVWVFRQTKKFQLSYLIGKQLGEPGNFGTAYRVKRKQKPHDIYVAKVIKKGELYRIDSSIEERQKILIQMKNEIDVMRTLKHKYIVQLRDIRETKNELFIIMDECKGGELFELIIKNKRLDERISKNIVKQIFEALCFMHEKYRIGHFDLKPDNILIANNGHVKLSDFGLAKSFTVSNDRVISKYQQKAKTLKINDNMQKPTSKDQRDQYRGQRRDRKLMYSTVGTPDYIAPEVFSQKGYDKMVDWWSQGVIMFECLVGYPPFYADTPLNTVRKIVHYQKTLRIPKTAELNKAAKDCIFQLICAPKRRMNFKQLKRHKFFKNVPWHDLRTVPPPFVPRVNSAWDTRYFEDVKNVEDNIGGNQEQRASGLLSSPQKGYNFQDFTFERPKKKQNNRQINGLFPVQDDAEAQ
mmetsp:Transcript_39553/g.48949  ORF Transcript_39553/g.48949 Transcript_39553/m.48949 type:complete len:467 (-) Transcript_39553:195-1595(-)